jgi:hypothetical protein
MECGCDKCNWWATYRWQCSYNDKYNYVSCYDPKNGHICDPHRCQQRLDLSTTPPSEKKERYYKVKTFISIGKKATTQFHDQYNIRKLPGEIIRDLLKQDRFVLTEEVEKIEIEKVSV